MAAFATESAPGALTGFPANAAPLLRCETKTHFCHESCSGHKAVVHLSSCKAECKWNSSCFAEFRSSVQAHAWEKPEGPLHPLLPPPHACSIEGDPPSCRVRALCSGATHFTWLSVPLHMARTVTPVTAAEALPECLLGSPPPAEHGLHALPPASQQPTGHCL